MPAYLPDVGALGFCGPGDDAGHGQSRLAGVAEVRRVHLPRQTLDVLEDGHLDLERPQSHRASLSQRVTESHRRRYLQVRRLRLIHDEPHQDVKLLVEGKRLPERKNDF